MEIYREVKQAKRQKHNATLSKISQLAIETNALFTETSDTETERETIIHGAPQQRTVSHRNNGSKRCRMCGCSTHLVRDCPMYYEKDKQGLCSNCDTETNYDDIHDGNYENCDKYDDFDDFQPHEERYDGEFDTGRDEQLQSPGNRYEVNYSHGQTQNDNRNQNEENGNFRRVNTIRFVEQEEQQEQEENQVSDIESGFY